MTAQSRKLFVNIMSFVILLITWWVVGSSVARTAVAMNGNFFDDSVTVLRGTYFNDWLPVFSSLIFGLGWCLGWFATSLIKSKFWIPLVLISLYLVFSTIILVIQISVEKTQYPVTVKLLELLSDLFLPGLVFGLSMNVLLRYGDGEFA